MLKEKLKILLIDDDEDDYILTRELLAEIPGKPTHITWVSHCEKALKELQDASYDVCLLDYNLGEKTGIEFLQQAKKFQVTTPIIMLTGQGDHEIDVLAMRQGAADYLVKGTVTASLLERSIRYALERQKTEAERLKLLREQTRRIEAEISQKRVTLLADASKILASTLDYRSALRVIAELIVPHMADWCVIDIMGKRSFERVIVLHKDPKKRALAEKLAKRFPPDLKSPAGVGKVLTTGKEEFYPVLSEKQREAVTRNNPTLLRVVSKLGLESCMILPIISREKILGTLSLSLGESGRVYNTFDLVLMRELAHRVAMAIDNALLYEKAQEGIQIRDEFLNIASHELKTPLTSLQLQIQLLSRTIQSDNSLKQDKRIAELFEANDRQIQRLTVLINNLLDVSKINSKHIELQRERVNLSEVISDVVKRFSNEARTSGTAIRFKNGVHTYGYWDKFRLDQVATNLVSNALKYGKGKPITVSVEKEKDTARLIVRDRGIGISVSDQNRIFKRFERTDTAKKFGGLGLGLYISKQIIQAHGGSISVSSTPTKGSTFTVELPLSQ